MLYYITVYNIGPAPIRRRASGTLPAPPGQEEH